MTRKKTGLPVAALFALLLAACQFFGDLVDPVEQSTAGFSGRVRSLKDSLAVRDVKVEIQGRSVLTDGAGRFSFPDLATGEHALSLGKPGFASQRAAVAVTLKETPGSFWLSPVNMLPVIDTFWASPASAPSRTWVVAFNFTVRDTTDSALSGTLILGPDDTLSLPDMAPGAQTVHSGFKTPGLHQVRLFLWDWEKKPVTMTVSVRVDSNTAPTVTLAQDKPFIETLCGKIRAILDDPDSNWKILKIGWGDVSAPLEVNDLVSSRDTLLYTHCYESPGTFYISAEIYDQNDVLGTYLLPVYVKSLVSPRIDQIACRPTTYNAARDDTLTIRIFVTSANAYVKEIYWSIITGAGKIEVRSDYNDSSGALPTDGQWFEHSFIGQAVDTLFPGDRSVQARFVDAADSTSGIITGSFKME